ncbi:hypothetical protein ADUPG1_006773 [Aduncisulcus paluster]|uniref:Uncharacterized protein n=1 Tax=Aduncisulcus paluster TaxID=2918883 RepID=A0ABQ5KJJ7_9EUKA|nr:hypothetical protein ADUPG1_006773 [Aduncisulcus paluster]
MNVYNKRMYKGELYLIKVYGYPIDQLTKELFDKAKEYTDADSEEVIDLIVSSSSSSVIANDQVDLPEIEIDFGPMVDHSQVDSITRSTLLQSTTPSLSYTDKVRIVLLSIRAISASRKDKRDLIS